MTATPQMSSKAKRKSKLNVTGQSPGGTLQVDQKPLYDRSKSPFRWFILFISCFALFGSYYCYDNPTALHTKFVNKFFADCSIAIQGQDALNADSGPPAAVNKTQSIYVTSLIPASGTKNIDTSLGSFHFAIEFNTDVTPSNCIGLLTDHTTDKTAEVQVSKGLHAANKIRFKIVKDQLKPGKKVGTSYSLALKDNSCVKDSKGAAFASPVEWTFYSVNDCKRMTAFQYNLLYSVYSFPNVILPLFGGMFVDKIGANYCILIFMCILSGGQAVFALGVSARNYALVLAGRTLYGFGGESLAVAMSSLLALWFKGKETAFAMGLNLSLARVGSVVNDQTSPAIYDMKDNLSTPIWFGVFVMLGCLGMMVFMVFMDKRSARKLEAKGFHVEKGGSDERVKFSDIKSFPLTFWLLTVSCVVVYACVLPFNNIVKTFLEDRFALSSSKSKDLMMIPFLISAVCSPFLGGVVDKVGKRAWLVLVASCCLMGAHLTMALSNDYSPVITLVVIGVSYCIYAAAVWPAVSLVIPSNQLGTAYGIITAVQNAGLALVPIILGAVEDANECTTSACQAEGGQYIWVEGVLAIFGGAGVLMAIWLLFEDARTGGKINAVVLDQKDNADANEPLLTSANKNEWDGDLQKAYGSTDPL